MTTNAAILTLAAALLASGAATAQETTAPAPKRIAADELARFLAPNADGFELGTLPLGAGSPNMLIVRRVKDGEVEIHDAQGDLFIARSGRATVKVGGAVTGQRNTGPGEWRGGTATGATSYEMTAGDMLWIPPGSAHQTIVPPGGAFDYLVLKTDKAP